MNRLTQILDPEAWGLRVGPNGELMVGDLSVVELAREYGTPVHILNEHRLEKTASQFWQSFRAAYPGKTSVHYAFKCNSVPVVVQTVRRAGLKAEVMTEFELDLAVHLGYDGEEIIVNGPCKTDAFLHKCVTEGVRLIVIDSLEELRVLSQISEAFGKDVCVLLRVNPDYVPQGMNRGTATGSRSRCAFGLDLKGGEVPVALRLLKQMKRVKFAGFHFHIGTGIRDPKDYSKALRCLAPMLAHTRSEGFAVKILDVGGGFASMTTREFTTREMLLYEGFDRLPSGMSRNCDASFDDFAREISIGVLQSFPSEELPELLFEPGRCLVSPNQFLLLTVHRVKQRPGVRKWLITDGGLGTVSMPTYYEYHEVFLCNNALRPRTERVTIIGPVCFAGDVVYRNKLMPEVRSGEVLAVMDSGAYFTALESSFGFPRPAIVSVHQGLHRLVRRRETFEEMVARDQLVTGTVIEEEVR
ncbi:MAG: hypothetical protein V3U69_05520 [Bacteroidota bacterium]